MTKDYYAILGIAPDTDQALIKDAAQARANEISEAFRVLGDIEQRKKYDALRMNTASATTHRTSAPTAILTETAAQAPASAEFSNASPAQSKHKQRSSIQFSQKQQSRQAGNTFVPDIGGGGLMNNLLAKMKIDPPNSAREVVIFLLSVVFVAYMASGFFADPQDRYTITPSLTRLHENK